MGKKKKRYIPKRFESAKVHKDIFASIYKSMIESEAFQSLTAQQKVLYLYCKLQYFGESRPEGAKCFTMHQYKWNVKYKLYSLGNAAGFYRDMSVLIEKGFVNCVEQGAVYKTKNIYEFSDRWQKYGTKDYVLNDSMLTAGMLRRKKK